MWRDDREPAAPHVCSPARHARSPARAAGWRGQTEDANPQGSRDLNLTFMAFRRAEATSPGTGLSASECHECQVQVAVPWGLAFPFGRAIQQPALEIWHGEQVNTHAAQQALYHRATCNRAARRGEYDAVIDHDETVLFKPPPMSDTLPVQERNDESDQKTL